MSFTFPLWERGDAASLPGARVTSASGPTPHEGKAARLLVDTGPNPEQNEQDPARSWGHTDGKRREIGALI